MGLFNFLQIDVESEVEALTSEYQSKMNDVAKRGEAEIVEKINAMGARVREAEVYCNEQIKHAGGEEKWKMSLYPRSADPNTRFKIDQIKKLYDSKRESYKKDLAVAKSKLQDQLKRDTEKINGEVRSKTDSLKKELDSKIKDLRSRDRVV